MLPSDIGSIKDYCPNTPLTQLSDIWLKERGINVFVKRDDLIDSRISGNKFRKLKYILHHYGCSKYEGIVSFGGPWSNHLHALSFMAQLYSIPLIAIVRGEKPAVVSDTLEDILHDGSQIHYVSRQEYRQMRSFSEQGTIHQHKRIKQWPNHLIIPEGGCKAEALLGVAEIIAEDNQPLDAVYVACGTGTTLAGLAIGLAHKPEIKIVAIAALKAGDAIKENVQRLLKEQALESTENWQINDDFNFGGFAKMTTKLIDFINQIYRRTGLVTEPVYTAKTLFALYQHIEEGRFAKGSNVMFIHTGGLQGLRGFRDRGLDVDSATSITYAAY